MINNPASRSIAGFDKPRLSLGLRDYTLAFTLIELLGVIAIIAILASLLFDDIETGWDSTCCGVNPGGMCWDKAHTQKATAANAGAALAGASLYRRSGEASVLDRLGLRRRLERRRPRDRL